MKKHYLSILATILLLSAFNPIFAQLANSPWPMFHHDLKHTGRSPYNGPENPSLKWKFQTGNSVGSSPAIGSDGTIYVGSSDNYLYAINPNGTQKWNFLTGTTGSGIQTSPAIGSDGTIYIGSSSGLYAINTNGTQKWKFPTGTGYDVNSSPVIGSDGTIYFGYSWDLYAINANGTQKWKFQTFLFIYSSPAIGTDGTIYIGSHDCYLYAVNPNGTEKWKFLTGAPIVYSSPVIGVDGTIYVGSGDGYLYAINPNGTLKWNSLIGGSYSSPAIGVDGSIYVGSGDDYLYAINPNGTQKWKFQTGGSISSSPAIGVDGSIYVGSGDGYLYAINPNGTQKWKFLAVSAVESSPAIGSDGTIYVGSDDNYLYAIGEAITPTPTPTLTQTATITHTLTQTQTLTPTLTQTPTPTQTPTQTATKTNTNTPTPTLTKTLTPTPTKTITSTPTLTATKTLTPIIPTQTPTITSTPLDYQPTLIDGKVQPETGDQNTQFEYLVFYEDQDGGSPPIKRVMINEKTYRMELKSGLSWQGTYNLLILGSELNIGENEFYFLFSDDEGNNVRLPLTGSFKNPWVNASITPTATITPSPNDTPTITETPLPTGIETPTPEITQTPTITPEPTITPKPTECLAITSPEDFYYNTVLLSWTPIYEASYYQLDIQLTGEEYVFYIQDNWVRIIAHDPIEWQAFVGVGTIPYKVTAYDAFGDRIEGPTEMSFFTCYSGNPQTENRLNLEKTLNQSAVTGCLRISNPPDFYFNTILLSWTPIKGADHYKFDYRYSNLSFTADFKDNFLRLIDPDEKVWQSIISIDQVYFRITAVDIQGNAIDGPTDWSMFQCY